MHNDSYVKKLLNYTMIQKMNYKNGKKVQKKYNRKYQKTKHKNQPLVSDPTLGLEDLLTSGGGSLAASSWSSSNMALGAPTTMGGWR